MGLGQGCNHLCITVLQTGPGGNGVVEAASLQRLQAHLALVRDRDARGRLAALTAPPLVS